MCTRAWTQINHPVCAANGFFVMLNDNNSVTGVPQTFQRSNQPLVVPRMQANAGFIKNVEHPPQGNAKLCRKANALHFPPG
jgi:molybdopterin-biosynthesis enzyme MoeA-like protein